MWKPYVSDDVKRLIVRGYQADKDVLHRVSILEKFLFANFPDWSRLYLWPDHLLYVEDCILHAKGARNVVLALLHDRTRIYAEHIAKRIEELPESTVKARLEGKPNETPTELSFRLASLHSAIAGQDIQQTVGLQAAELPPCASDSAVDKRRRIARLQGDTGTIPTKGATRAWNDGGCVLFLHEINLSLAKTV